MSRRGISTVEEPKTINQIIEKYYVRDCDIKALKKDADEDKAYIKDYFIEKGLKEMVVNDIKCTVNVTNRQSFNTDMCLATLEAMKNSGEITEEMYNSIVKTAPYVDEDALEAALYNNFINPEKLSECIDNKEVVTLKCSKAKKK